MTRPIDLLREGRKEELWQMCCGFLNLSLEQFMTIQKRLLLEQIDLLKDCELGQRIMRGAMPETIEEFREQVPLTTYDDYLPDLVERREDGLPKKPDMWVRTVGRAGEYNLKFVPLSPRFVYEFERVAGGVGLLASCDSRGNFPLKEHLKTLSTMASRHYGSGIAGYLMQKALGFDLMPSDAEEMTFQQRIEDGFQEGLCQGVDALGGLPPILAYVGEMFKQGMMNINSRFLLSHPAALVRYVKGLLKSRLAHRPMLPKDLWSVKAVAGGGTDSATFRDRVEELWGRCPLEAYGGTEGGIYATQTWDYDGMTFVPNLNFFEFIPEREYFKWQLDHSYEPRAVLMDEVRAGEKYELVITNLHGGALVRYRVGDLIKITSLRNEKLGIDIPQMLFDSRADDLIDIASLGRLTERVIQEAVENSGIAYVDWVARKELVDEKPTLHFYLEPGDGYVASQEGVAVAIREQLRQLDRKYRCNFYNLIGDMETRLDLKPLQVTLLSRGAFSDYVNRWQVQGASSSYSKISRINPPAAVLSLLGVSKAVVEAIPVTEAERAATR